MKSRIDFSVSMSVYVKDSPEHFEYALNSVFNQSEEPSEVVLVVDGPVSEKIKTLVNFFESKFNQLSVVWLPKNVGHGNARRIGLENCSNNIVALMDADDICRRGRFEYQLDEFLRNKELAVVGGQISEFEGDISNPVGVRKVPLSHDNIVLASKLKCPMNQMTVMFSKEEVQKSGGYLDWYCNEDYYLWIRMLINNSKFRNIDEILVDVRVGIDMYRRRGGMKYFLSELKLQRFMLKENWINSFQFIVNIGVRFIVQVLMPNTLRAYVFKNILRKKRIHE